MTVTTTSSRLRPFKPVPFGRYTLLLPLATGGMGEIFLARMDGAGGFEKLCVIKRILPHLAEDRDFVTRFINEAKTLAKLSHGSIAQILELGKVDGTPYLAMEYVDGKDLRRISARMRDRNLPMPLTFVIFVMTRVLDALAYAHRKRDDDEHEIGLVHRDVSPQNVLISYEGEVKVIDFGLAKSTLVESNTQPSIVLGKFLYMSPEQARHQTVDRRSDLYSVGLCLYELLAGKNPFDDIAPGELMARVAAPNIRPLSQAEPLTPPAVAQVVMKALNPDPNQRFQTAEEFRGRLTACLMDIDPSAGPESVSRFMRDAFGVEHAAEKKLQAALREQARPPIDEPDTGVHLVQPQPPPGRPVLEPVAARRDSKPLALKPTPTSRAQNTDFSDRERETMPGVLKAEGHNRHGEAETAQIGVVPDPGSLRQAPPPRVAPVSPGIIAGKMIEPTEPGGVALASPRPRASAPANAPHAAHAPHAAVHPASSTAPHVGPHPVSHAAPPTGHGQAPTMQMLPMVGERPSETTDPSLVPVAGPSAKRHEITRPLVPVVAPPPQLMAPPVGSPLDTLPPSGPQPALGGSAPIPPLATDAAAAAVMGPMPEPMPEVKTLRVGGEAKPSAPVVERVPRALEKAAPPMTIDTQRTKSARPSMLLILLPLVAVLGAAGFIGYDLWKEQQTVDQSEKDLSLPRPPTPTPTKRREDVPPPTEPAEDTKPPVADDDLVELDPAAKPRVPVPGKKKVLGPTATAIGELKQAYDAFGNAGGAQNKFKLKLEVMRNRADSKMGPSEEAVFVQDVEKLKREIQKAQGEIIKE